MSVLLDCHATWHRGYPTGPEVPRMSQSVSRDGILTLLVQTARSSSPSPPPTRPDADDADRWRRPCGSSRSAGRWPRSACGLLVPWWRIARRTLCRSTLALRAIDETVSPLANVAASAGLVSSGWAGGRSMAKDFNAVTTAEVVTLSSAPIAKAARECATYCSRSHCGSSIWILL
jgi:hypothetical protein